MPFYAGAVPPRLPLMDLEFRLLLDILESLVSLFYSGAEVSDLMA
jgi:hypothetical protein